MEPESMAKDDYIGFRIASSTKERWENQADENPEYRSLTHLICVAVEAELADDDETGGSVGEMEIDLSRLHDRFDSVQRQMDTIEDRLDETYILVRDEQDSEVLDIMEQALDYIPEPEDVESLLSDDPSRYDDPATRVRRTGQVAALVEEMCADGEYREFEVKQALERLSEVMSTVELRDATPQADTIDKRVYRLPE